jgi:hypothetical protein
MEAGELSHERAERCARARVEHGVERVQRGNANADPIRPPHIGNALRDLKEQADAVRHRSPVRIGSLVGTVPHELIEQITVGAVDLHAIESGKHRVSRRATKLLDDVRKLVERQRARRDEWSEPVIGCRLPAGGNRRRCDGEAFPRLQRGMRHAPTVKQLQEEAAPEAVHRIHHRSPARDLISRVNARHAWIPHCLLRHGGRLGENHGGAGPLCVVDDRGW